MIMLVSLIFCAPCVLAEEAREDCRVCGMWIDQYMHTRHVLTAADGTQVSFCSFACAARYLNKEKVDAAGLQAADFLTTDLVSAKDAFYLVGSDAPPVMSYISIIAFASREEAENFQKSHGGQIMTFDEALAQQ